MSEVKLWRAEDYPEGSSASQGACRFAPTCDRYAECPDAPAEFSEQLGGDSLGGYARYMSVCRGKAIERNGLHAIERAEGTR